MTHRYTSPFRPLDIGYAARVGEVEIDWDATDIGPDANFTLKTRIYAFTAALPAGVVEGFQLKNVTNG